MLNKILYGAHELPFTVIIIRSVILYIAVIIATRLMGKRQVGILTGHNYLVAAGIVSLVAVRMVSPDTSLISALVIVFTYALINRYWSYLDLIFPVLIDRRPVVLMENGEILLKNLKKVQLTIDDFLMGLRQKKVWNLSEVHQVVFEPTGELSVLKLNEFSPATVKDMKIQKEPPKNVLPTIVLTTGNTNEFHLKQLGDISREHTGLIINPDDTITLIRK